MPDRSRREAIVREHMESENVHDFDTTIGTFEHPRYEIISTGRSSTARSRCGSTSAPPAPRSRTNATSLSRYITPTTP